MADPKIATLRERVSALTASINTFVLEHHTGKEDAFETEEWRLTPVRGTTSTWNVVKLQKVVPKGLFLKIVDYIPNPEKIDELVRAGKLDRKKIAKALETTPKAPYVKATKVGDKNAGVKEADKLAEAMGA